MTVRLTLTPAVVAAHLVKRFDALTALDDVSFQVATGSTTALLGGNGAGKTTTISILLGLLMPTSGSVTVLGCDMLRHRYRVLGAMNFSSPYVDLPRRLTVSENLKVYGRLYGVRDLRGRIAELSRELESEQLPRSADRQLVDRPAHPGDAGQGAAQPAAPASARRADRLA